MAIDFIFATWSLSNKELQNDGDLDNTFESLWEEDNPKYEFQIHRSFPAIQRRQE
jgi:hypothetical protein